MAVRTTVVLEDAVIKRIKTLVPPRRLSRFINTILAEKLQEMVKQELSERMKQGYIATRKERERYNKEWEVVSTEGWE